jgi:hypothetical protein
MPELCIGPNPLIKLFISRRSQTSLAELAFGV